MGGVNDEMHISESPQLGVIEKQVLVSTAHLKALGEKWFRVYVGVVGLAVMKESDTLKKHVVKAESTLFAICARIKVAKIDYMSFALTKKRGRGTLIENKRACGKKGLVWGVSAVLPFALLSSVPSYCMAYLFTH